ncbi:MAG: hypothetical protein AAF467_28380 [Actinomycetota bacterium]
MLSAGSQVQFLAAALRGLDAQREAAEHNLANIETPGFRARRVSFADSLRDAMAAGDPSLAQVRVHQTRAGNRLDESNVNPTAEITSLELNALQQQLVTEAINSHYDRLRTALGA